MAERQTLFYNQVYCN